jgi:hypothetical protein
MSPSQDLGRRNPVHVVADDQTAQFLEHQDQAIGHQHLLQMLTLVEEAEEGPLEHIAEQHREHEADRQGREESAAERGRHQRCQRVGHVRADHVEAAVRQVDDAHDAEDQRQAGSDQEQQQPVLQRVQALNQEDGQGHARGAWCARLKWAAPAAPCGKGGEAARRMVAKPTTCSRGPDRPATCSPPQPPCSPCRRPGAGRCPAPGCAPWTA